MSLLSSRDQKKIDLLQILFSEDLNHNYLLNYLDVSFNTLKRMIEEINIQINPAKIENLNGLLSLKLTNNSSFDTCLSKIIDSSLEYKILELLFFKNDLNFTDLANILYVSDSTIKRSIKILNRKLNDADIKIKNSPLEVIGNETNIRIMFVMLLENKYGLSGIPFSQEDVDLCNELYLAACKLKKRQITIQDQFNCNLFLLVALYREKLGYSKKNIMSHSEKKLIAYIYNAAVSKPFSSYYLQNINKELIFDICSTFITVISFTENTYKSQVDSIKIFLDNVCYAFDIKISADHMYYTIESLYQILYNFLRIPKTIPSIINEYDMFINNLSSLEKEFVELLKKIFKISFNNDDLYYFNFIYYMLKTKNLKLIDSILSSSPAIRILIYVDFDFDFGLLLKKQITDLTQRNISLDIVVIRYITEIKDDDTDIFITNILDKDNTDSLLISRFINTPDLKKIVDRIYSVYTEKMHQVLHKAKEKFLILKKV